MRELEGGRYDSSMSDDDSAVLGELVLQLARLQRARSRQVLAPWELSPSQHRALRVITERGGVRVSEVAQALRITPRSATEVSDSLQAQGLVERVPDPSDRRAVLLRPTPAAQALAGELEAARTADARLRFGRLSPQDRATLARILRSLIEQNDEPHPLAGSTDGSEGEGRS
jgi:DNA-binding MarR family transcriptional regulator